MISISVKGFDKGRLRRKVYNGVALGIRDVGLRGERFAKPRAVVDKGRYKSSITVERWNRRLLSIILRPHVVYAGWLEEGSRSRHAPKTHKSSRFKGYKLMTRTRKYLKRVAPLIIAQRIRRTVG